MEENAFWLRLWQSGAVALVLIVLTVAGCNARQVTAIERLVKDGADPVKAACAIQGSGSSPACVIAATK